MQTQFIRQLPNKTLSTEAESILRKCVHCGFCNTACPTYQLTGNELDGPRGRIYQIKMVLEGETPSTSHIHHLDRCLTCRACEPACPSGVQYARLLAIGRTYIAQQVKRHWLERLKRFLVLRTLPYTRRTRYLLAAMRCLKPLLAKTWADMLPPLIPVVKLETNTQHRRKILMLSGCVQAAAAPHINAHIRSLLDKLGIETIELKNACCGALPHHMEDHERAHRLIIDNITRIQPFLDAGVEAIVTTASGCGDVLLSYGDILKNDPDYADQAIGISQMHKDIAEIIDTESMNNPRAKSLRAKMKQAVFQCPCSLQHGQRLNGKVEAILARYGVELPAIKDQTLCCGSAGYYSLSQQQIAAQLRTQKLQNLLTHQPEVILTANIGCQMHLQTKSPVPVMHWTTLLH